MLSWSELIDPGVADADFHSLLVRPVLQQDYCADSADVPWLSLSVGGGVVSPQSQQTITATLNPSGLAPGSYNATLCVASSDPRNRRLPVRVTFNVGDRIFSSVSTAIDRGRWACGSPAARPALHARSAR